MTDALLDYFGTALTADERKLLAISDGRRALTRTDPQLFACVYLRHHLRGPETQDAITFSEAHLDWYRQMRQWIYPVSTPREWRNAYVAPRASAKSTTWFTIAPLWAAAHGHVRFAAAFADSAAQAEQHLATFKHELATNSLLRRDYPDLCNVTRNTGGPQLTDNRQMLQTKSGFVFAARGIDASSLGMKVGDRRPDLLILDDIEPGESNYSPYQVERRLVTIQDVVLPLNEHARVVLVGTVTMAGSIVHQLMESPPPKWVNDEKFKLHYYPAIIKNSDGTERSLWPEKWPMDWLNSVRDTRSFAKNMMNDPVPEDGEYWQPDDFRIEALPSVSRRIISIDPAVTTKRTSDQTAVAVVSFSAAARQASVDEVVGYRLKGEPLRQRVLDLLALYPDVSDIVFESNQGGELLAGSLLHDMPVPVRTVHQSEKKEVRAEKLLTRYRRQQVVHAKRLIHFEQQCMAFPKGMHDDLIDAVGTGIEWLANAGSRRFAVASR